MSSRNDSASILTVGCSWTNFDSGPDATSITPTAMTTAAIMTGSSSAMPTAVRTESSENTMSSRTIWTITLPERCRPAAGVGVVRLFALERLVDLGRGLPEQEQAAADEDEVAPRERVSPIVNTGSVSPTIQRDREQQQDAHAHRQSEPDLSSPDRAGARGARWTRTEMKMTLSMPRTISRTVRVSREIQISGLVSSSMVEEDSGSNPVLGVP